MQKLSLVLHVALSLIGILTGFFVIFGLVTSQRFDALTLVFLASTIATSVTGFPPFFRFEKLLPSHVVGVISLVVLALAVYARYAAALVGGWSTTYVVAAVVAQYLNVFVLVVQLFLKVPALKALAPTQKEAPFKIAQTVVLLAFIAGGWIATTSFEPLTASP
jgi:hypothetical protein